MVVSRSRHAGVDGSTTYSVRETAKRIGVVYDVVLRYIRDGKLRATKLRTKGLREEWRIPAEEIERFLAGRRT